MTPPVSAPSPVLPAGEREKFEKWGRELFNYGFKTERNADGGYAHEGTDTAWEAWQARAALASSPPAEPVAMPQYWSVEVTVDGDQLVSIGNDWLSGSRSLEEQDEKHILGAAQHLLSFIGHGLPSMTFDPDEAAPPAVPAQRLTDEEISGIWSKMPKHHSIVEFAREVLRRAAPPQAEAAASPDDARAHLSWSGFNVSGDRESIAEVRKLVECGDAWAEHLRQAAASPDDARDAGAPAAIEALEYLLLSIITRADKDFAERAVVRAVGALQVNMPGWSPPVHGPWDGGSFEWVKTWESAAAAPDAPAAQPDVIERLRTALAKLICEPGHLGYRDQAREALAASTSASPAAQPTDYELRNPLGGPAKVFDACADLIRAGDSVERAMALFGLAWAAPAAQPQVVDDLSALVARLARALRKAAPQHEMPALATDYLKRKNLLGSPLRDNSKENS